MQQRIELERQVTDWAVLFGDEVMLFLPTESQDNERHGQVEHIWKSRWSIVKALYLWTRYSPFVDVSLNLNCALTFTLAPSKCSRFSNRQPNIRLERGGMSRRMARSLLSLTSAHSGALDCIGLFLVRVWSRRSSRRAHAEYCQSCLRSGCI